MKKNCLICSKEFTIVASREFKAKFCSIACKAVSMKGNDIGVHTKGVRNNTGRTHFKKGSIPWNWKGVEAGYSAHHHWVKRKLGMPCKCELCGTQETRKYHWANISGEYKRELCDYMSACVPCHKLYDLARI